MRVRASKKKKYLYETWYYVIVISSFDPKPRFPWPCIHCPKEINRPLSGVTGNVESEKGFFGSNPFKLVKFNVDI